MKQRSFIRSALISAISILLPKSLRALWTFASQDEWPDPSSANLPGAPTSSHVEVALYPDGSPVIRCDPFTSETVSVPNTNIVLSVPPVGESAVLALDNGDFLVSNDGSYLTIRNLRPTPVNMGRITFHAPTSKRILPRQR